MTTDERLATLEDISQKHEARLERHSDRLKKLESQSQDVAEMKSDLSGMKTEIVGMKKTIKKIEQHQAVTDKKLLAKSNWTIALLCCIVGLVVYIAIKSPETAKDVISLTSRAVAEGVTAL